MGTVPLKKLLSISLCPVCVSVCERERESTACCVLRAACCVPLEAYCLLLTAYCLLLVVLSTEYLHYLHCMDISKCIGSRVQRGEESAIRKVAATCTGHVNQSLGTAGKLVVAVRSS